MRNVSSFGVPRVVGYSCLLMGFINWADILFSPQFLNPTWQLQSVGAIVESVPLLFFSLMLIFYGENLHRKKLENVLVNILSRACLPLALCFFLLLPVAIHSTIRIEREISVQTDTALAEQLEQIDQLKQQLDEATEEQVIGILSSQGVQVEAQSESPKEQLFEYLTETAKEIQARTSDSGNRAKKSTMKNALKWTIGAVLSSITCLYLWSLTRWARLVNPLLSSNRSKQMIDTDLFKRLTQSVSIFWKGKN